ncbi:MAG: hypothetical protein LBM71_04520 [Elusimicrobiota bacterium]|jgi:methyl-accepting chemotaxis protein|nr:hypothetical protein [Elusimicrobiota bacterium]
MTINSEEKLKEMLEEVETAKDKLRDINARLKQYYSRMESISAQSRRKLPIKDEALQGEFRSTVEELRKMADKTQDFWQEVRRNYQAKDRKNESIRDNRVLIKQINISALSFTRQVDELFTTFKNMQAISKDVPLRLNWWLLESSTDDLFKITDKILFLMRDMEKHYAQ